MMDHRMWSEMLMLKIIHIIESRNRLHVKIDSGNLIKFIKIIIINLVTLGNIKHNQMYKIYVILSSKKLSLKRIEINYIDSTTI